jgi:hypothetical protein
MRPSYPSSIKSDNRVASSSQWKTESSESESSSSMLGIVSNAALCFSKLRSVRFGITSGLLVSKTLDDDAEACGLGESGNTPDANRFLR